MNKLFQERLLKAIKESKLTQSEISKRTGISRGSITDYVKGRYEAKQDKVYDLAQVLGVRSEWLMGFNVSKNDSETHQFFPTDQVPVVSEISAGTPLYAEQNLMGYAHLPSFLNKVGKEMFYLKVDGDSMDKEFNDGDLVLVEKDAPIEQGQIGVMLLNGYNATVKRVRYDNEKVVLYPESYNSSHIPQVYSSNDEVSFIGRVISSQKFY